MSDIKLKILFLCTGNSCRSQMAEGWAHELKSDVIEAYSAGIETHGLNPHAVKVMKEAGVDISNYKSECVDDLLGIDFDYVITVCDNAHETCPVFTGKAKVVHVGFDDPPALAANTKTDEEALNHYRRVRDEIREFVERLPMSLSNASDKMIGRSDKNPASRKAAPGGAKLSERADSRKAVVGGAKLSERADSRKAVVGETTAPSATTQARSESFAPPFGRALPAVACSESFALPFGRALPAVARSESFALPFGRALPACPATAGSESFALPGEMRGITCSDSSSRFFSRKKLPHGVPSWVGQGARHFITINCKQRFGDPLFKNEIPEKLLESALFYEEMNKWYLWLMVIMPDHVHFIATFDLDKGIKSTVNSWKRYQKKTINIDWQKDFFEHRLRNETEYEEKAFYIRMNPVRKRLVELAEQWPHIIDRTEKDGKQD